MSRPGRFGGHVVLITGASSGIGAALAREFAREGADLVLAARRVDRLEHLRAELSAFGGAALAVRCDVTVDGDVEHAVAAARDRFGRLDVVVANAGFGVVGPMEQLTLADYRRQLETNVFGVLRTVYATLADLRRSRGRLALLGSVAGHLAVPGASAYSMSKFAVRALAVTLDHELARDGVSVTLVSPGFVDTDIRRTDNQGVVRPEARDPAPAHLRMPAARAARQIVRAVARRRREVVVTRLGKVAVFLQRHTPWLVAWGIRRIPIRSRPEPASRAPG